MWALINGLPPDAAVWRVDGQQWTLHEELLAIAVERIDAWGVAHARLSGGGKALKDYTPLRVPRPGVQENGAPKRREISAREKSQRRKALFT